MGPARLRVQRGGFAGGCVLAVVESALLRGYPRTAAAPVRPNRVLSILQSNREDGIGAER